MVHYIAELTKVQFLANVVIYGSKWSPILAELTKVQLLAKVVRYGSKWSIILAELIKVQFLHLLCYWCSLIVEIATFWPHFTTGPPNVPL